VVVAAAVLAGARGAVVAAGRAADDRRAPEVPARVVVRGRLVVLAAGLAAARGVSAAAARAAGATGAAGALGADGAATGAGAATTGAVAAAGCEVGVVVSFAFFGFALAGLFVSVAAAASCPAPSRVAAACNPAAVHRDSFFTWPEATGSPAPEGVPPCFVASDFADATGATAWSAVAATSIASVARARRGKLWGIPPLRAVGRCEFITS